MFPLLGGLASGVGSLLGSMFTNSQSAENQQQAEAYQTQMSNTAYQRASADMKSAGLNPMMMFGNGSSASTPSAPPISLQNPGNSVATGINTAVQLKTADATVDRMAQEVAASKTDQVLREAETETERNKPDLVRSESALRGAEYRDVSNRAVVSGNSAVTARNQSAMDPSIRGPLDRASYAGGAVDRAISPATDLVSSATGLRNLVRPRRSTVETTRDDGSSSFSERYHY